MWGSQRIQGHNCQNRIQSAVCSSSQNCLQILFTTVCFKPSSLLAVLAFCFVWLVIPRAPNHYHHPPLTGMQTVFLPLISTPWREWQVWELIAWHHPDTCRQQSLLPGLDQVSGALCWVGASVSPLPSLRKWKRKRKEINLAVMFPELLLLTRCRSVVDKCSITQLKKTDRILYLCTW